MTEGTTLGPAVKAWVEAATSSEVVSTRVLRGGIRRTVHEVVLTREGSTMNSACVLRQFVDDVDAERAFFAEIRTLEHLAGTSIPAPEVLHASDLPVADRHLLLLRKLPGEGTTLRHFTQACVEQVSELARRVHALDAPGTHPTYVPWYAAQVPTVPRWTSRPALWDDALELLTQGPPPPAPATFIHGDFHPGNLLWSGSELTGIVDWEWASIGPPGEDIAHWRANAAILTGQDIDIASPHPLHPWWDLVAILEFQDPARQLPNFRAVSPDISLVTIFERIESFLERTLANFSKDP